MGDVVTFYSYKGGAGRTFLMANVAAQLSKWGYKVLCIDWDLEAPGLHYYFRSWLSKLPEYGLLELIEASLTNKDVGWDKYTTSLRLPRADSRLSFIFAGAQDESYKSRVQGLDWSTLYSKGFGNFLERLRSEWKELYDFVLIDSRTGITDIGGICTVQLPDILAFVFTANAQSIEGAVDVVHRAVESRRKLLFDRARFIAIPVLSRFDDREEKKLSEEWMADIENKVAPVVSAWRHQSVRTGELLYRLMVPYFSFWSFGEGLPVVTDARSDQGSINYNFQTIASVIAHRGNGTNNLVLARDTYVISASERVQPEEAALMLALDERQISSRRADLKAHGDLELFKVTTPTKEELRYRYHVLASGLSYVGYLTYELPARSYERTIIMVNGSALVGKLSEWQRNEYSRLVEFVSEAAGGSTGIKNIVNRLAEKEFANLPNVSIAVHKFGPVPVYLLPESYIVKPFGEDVEVQIGLYPAVKPRRRAGGRVPFPSLPFLATKSEFVRSLNVGLGLMFQRYLEDVGERLYDISYQNLSGVISLAKEVESILAESIKSKLDLVTPSAQVFQHPQKEDEALVKELFEKEYSWIFTARYARQFALYFLNELYRIIGVESRGDSYLGGFVSIRDEFDALLGKDYVRTALRELPLVALLSRVLRAYRDGDNESLREINVDGETLWVRRFVQFAKFVASFAEESLPPTAGRIFISSLPDSATADVMKLQIRSYIEKTFGDGVKVLSAEEGRVRLEFKAFVTERIWQCDTLVAVLTRDEGAAPRGYLWVATEVQYALLLGKRVVFIVEKGTDETQMLAELRREHGALIPADVRVPEWLQERLLESFTEYTRAMFTVDTTQTSEQDLDPSVIRAIHGEAEQAIERRHNDILLGFHRQFPEWARRTLKHIQETVTYPKAATKKMLASQFYIKYKSSYRDEKAAEKAITNTWNLARYRALLIGEKSMPLMRLLDGRKYSGNLRQIMKELRPDLDKTNIDEWERRVLKSVVLDYDSG